MIARCEHCGGTSVIYKILYGVYTECLNCARLIWLDKPEEGTPVKKHTLEFA